MIPDPFIKEPSGTHAKPFFNRGLEGLTAVASLRGRADLRTGGMDADQHEVQCGLQCCGEVLVTRSAQSADVEDQDESAQEVHGPVHFIVLGGQNGGSADEENAQGSASAQEEADEVGVKGGFVGVCSAVDDDVPHADPCHQDVEQYQDGGYGQVHGSVIAGLAGEPLGKGLWRRPRCRRDRALGAMLSYGRSRVCRYAADRMADADLWWADTCRVGHYSCRRSGAVLLLSASCATWAYCFRVLRMEAGLTWRSDLMAVALKCINFIESAREKSSRFET